MTSSFAGGSAGSWLGVRAYTLLGEPRVCALLATVAALALAWHVLRRARRRNSTPVEAAGENADAVR
jgi:hypothetical protein